MTSVLAMVRHLPGRGPLDVHAVETDPDAPTFPALCGQRLRRMHVELLPWSQHPDACAECALRLPTGWPTHDADAAEVSGVAYAMALNGEQRRHLLSAHAARYGLHGRTVALSECGFMVFVPDPPALPGPRPSWPLCQECVRAGTVLDA